MNNKICEKIILSFKELLNSHNISIENDIENIKDPILEILNHSKLNVEDLDFICSIIDVFEDFLCERDICIPNIEREGYEEEACIYGDDYYFLEDEIKEIISDTIKE